jgi:hypothetical protein
MSTQLTQELNAAQAAIYTRSNLRRAYEGFDETEIAGIYLRGDTCVVVRRDGSEQTYNAELIRSAYIKYTYRLKDFFSYLGPNYRGPSIWHNNAYIMFKGWHYSHALGHLSQAAALQRTWADKFIHLSDRTRLVHLLQSDQTDLGHLVAPDGFREGPKPLDFDDAGLESEDETSSFKEPTPQPYCSCGSFQRQLNNLSEFQAEIKGYQPSCIHLTWFQKYRELLCKRTEIRNASPGATPSKCVAWWYAPPSDSVSDGRFVLLHTKSGAQAPLTHWRTYKPKEIFTQQDAWDLFFNMMDAGYIPFPGTALPQLQSVVKK